MGRGFGHDPAPYFQERFDDLSSVLDRPTKFAAATFPRPDGLAQRHRLADQLLADESPLVEDNSAKSPAYTTFDLQFGYQRAGRWSLAVDTFNLFDVKWNDIEYYYVSRLQNEATPRADYVVHPGVPRTIRAHVQVFL